MGPLPTVSITGGQLERSLAVSTQTRSSSRPGGSLASTAFTRWTGQFTASLLGVAKEGFIGFGHPSQLLSALGAVFFFGGVFNEAQMALGFGIVFLAYFYGHGIGIILQIIANHLKTTEEYESSQ